jgi:hypothetical protein
MFPLTYLFIPCLDPISVESMAPESTLMIVSGMGLMEINALSRMRSWSTLRGRADRGVAGLKDPLFSTWQEHNGALCDEVPCKWDT